MVARFGSAERAFASLDPEQGSASLQAALQVTASATAIGATALALGEEGYPPSLLDLPDPPPVLFARGRVELLHGRTMVAVVGTRRATAYGERVARELGAQLAGAGAVVVSGMARGIDAAAHLGALGAGGDTIAVLGTGLDIAYPASHRTLHADLASRGLLLGEQPPGARATPGSFPERNRIIAALCALTVVVEADRKSGALITASRALELGRTVAAVPGPIDVPQHAGANELLRDGAQVVASVADVVALAGLTRPPRRPAPEVAPADRAVWDALARGALDLDSIAARTALPAREVMAAVTRLELGGSVECALTGEVRRR